MTIGQIRETKILDWIKTLPMEEMISNTQINKDIPSVTKGDICKVLHKHHIEYEHVSKQGIILKSKRNDIVSYISKNSPRYIEGAINSKGLQNIYQIGTKSYEVYLWLQNANRNELITYTQLFDLFPKIRISFIKQIIHNENVEFISTYGKGFTLMNKDNAVDIVENKMKKITSSINRAEECLENVKDIEVSKEDSKKIESYKTNITYFQTYNNKIWGMSNSAE